MYTARYKEYVLKFKFPAGTSRGVLVHKKSWFIIIEKDDIEGIGECSIIPELSPDDTSGLKAKITDLCLFINQGNNPHDFELKGFPALKFALETAMNDLNEGGRRVLYATEFTEGKRPIPINGLIWMGDEEFILNQIKEKVNSGYTCLKLKIGASDFESELKLIQQIRMKFSDIEIRLDANGGFKTHEIFTKIEQLSKFGIHSLEQPVKPGHIAEMSSICRNSPIPIALDEELIGIYDSDEKQKLIQLIKPAYLILKPSLLGGIEAAYDWITLASEAGIGWWVTSALESNIGLNAIAQWVSTLDTKMVQGLGTGQLYENNISSPLIIKNSDLYYLAEEGWNLDPIFT